MGCYCNHFYRGHPSTSRRGGLKLPCALFSHFLFLFSLFSHRCAFLFQPVFVTTAVRQDFRDVRCLCENIIIRRHRWRVVAPYIAACDVAVESIPQYVRVLHRADSLIHRLPNLPRAFHSMLAVHFHRVFNPQTIPRYHDDFRRGPRAFLQGKPKCRGEAVLGS